MTSPADTEARRPTRSAAFEKRLKQRYAQERRFKLFGLFAIIVSIAILFVLLGNMTINGVGGFQRAELQVPIDFAESGLAGDAASLSQPGAVQTLEMQGLPEIVAFAAEQRMGAAGAEPSRR